MVSIRSTDLWHRAKQIFYRSITRYLSDSKGTVILPVLSGPGKGLRFGFRFQAASEGQIFLGRYELAIATALSRKIERDWVVWDCGTYLGYYTCLFARAVGPKGKVLAFEPDPTNYGRTVSNIGLNGFTHVETRQVAIGAPSSTIAFVSTANQTSHVLGTFVGGMELKGTEVPERSQIIEVRCMSLDEIVSEPTSAMPHLVKLDLEGAEAIALQYADQLVRRCRPRFVVELHNPECDEALWKFSEAHSYRLSSLATLEAISDFTQVRGIVYAEPMELRPPK
jgi:FkbM family methyltransferase